MISDRKLKRLTSVFRLSTTSLGESTDVKLHRRGDVLKIYATLTAAIPLQVGIPPTSNLNVSRCICMGNIRRRPQPTDVCMLSLLASRATSAANLRCIHLKNRQEESLACL